MKLLTAVRDEEFRYNPESPGETWLSSYIPHECFWCGHLTWTPFWSCRTCYPKKEAAYKRCREQGITGWDAVIAEATKECNK